MRKLSPRSRRSSVYQRFISIYPQCIAGSLTLEQDGLDPGALLRTIAGCNGHAIRNPQDLTAGSDVA